MPEVEPPRRPGFTFVLNVARIVGAEQYEIAPGHYLRKANDEEVEFIKAYLQRIDALLLVDAGHWEIRLGQNNGERELLPPTEWRYHVVSYPEILDTRVEFALDLSPNEVEFGFEVIFSKQNMPMVRYSPDRFLNVLHGVPTDGGSFIDVQESHARAIGEVVAQVVNNAPHPQEWRRLLDQLRSLKHLPRESPLVFLGYFGILEALLTHAPKPADPYDSITRQVKNKVALLNNTWSESIDYAPFGGAKPELIWGRMYSYRSLLAHGHDAQFTGDLSVLKSQNCALALLKSTVKSVLLHALREPRFIADLKNC